MSGKVTASAIVVDSNGNTVGAELVINNKRVFVATEKLKDEHERIKIENAVVDSRGFVRAKSGNLRKVIMNTKPNTLENRDIIKANTITRQKSIILYHGNKDKSMIPKYGCGNKDNDYGEGFYTTADKELGKEWAMSSYTRGNKGYLHTYELSLEGLKILDLTKLDSLHWIAELLVNRRINTDGREALQDDIDKFIDKYKLNTDGYDVIIGYRADDSYFTYAEDFMTGAIYKETLEHALRFGNLGLQMFIKSRNAFNQLKIVCEPEVVHDKYKVLCERRRQLAVEEYNQITRNRQDVKKKERVFDFI